MSNIPLILDLQVQNAAQAEQALSGVGNAAQQAGGQLDQVGSKGKSTGQSLQQLGNSIQLTALNAFNFAESIISMKRSYEDISRAQNTFQNKQDAVTKATNKVENAILSLRKAQKKGDAAGIIKAENNLANARLNLDRVTRGLTFAQVDLNRKQEDFYLSIIPNMVSGLGTLFGLFQVLQGAGGIGGVLGSLKILGPIGIALGAAFLAVKTNFLGVKDALVGIGVVIGNALPGLRPFLDVLGEIGGVLGLGTGKAPRKSPFKGGKGGLNDAISHLQNSFKPIIDTVKNVIDSIMKGDWAGAFGTIKSAALNMWHSLAASIPLFNSINDVVNLIKKGDWAGAWGVISASIGEWWRSTAPQIVQLGKDIISRINEGLKTAGIDLSALPGQIDAWFKNHRLTTSIPLAGGITFAVEDPLFRASLVAGATAIVNALGAALKAISPTLTSFSRAVIDPFLASLFDASTWINAISELGAKGSDVGTAIWSAITSAVGSAVSTGGKVDWGKAGQGILDGISEWLKANDPLTVVAATNWANGIGNAIGTALKNAPQAMLDTGKALMMSIFDAAKKAPEVVGQFMAWLFEEIKKKLGIPSGWHFPTAPTGGPSITGVGFNRQQTLGKFHRSQTTPELPEFPTGQDKGAQAFPGSGGGKTIQLSNTQAIKAVDVVKAAINTLGSLRPQISLLNNNAFSSISTVAGGINNLGSLRPQLSLLNNNAISSISTVSGQITALEKIQPQIALQNRNAFSAIDTVAGAIKDLENIKPNIVITTVHRTIWAAHGFHGVVSGPTPFVAGERGPEKVDVTPLSGGGGSRVTVGSRGRGGGGGATGGRFLPVIVNINGKVLADIVAELMDDNSSGYH